MEDSLKKRYMVKLLASFINGIVNIIIVAIVPKALGPVAFGQFSYLQQFFSQILGFVDAGTSTAFFTKLSARNERRELISYYFIVSILLFLLLYLFVFGIDILGVSDRVLPDIPTEYIYYGLWFGFFTWMIQVYVKVSDAYALTVSVELIKIVHKLFSLALLFFMIHYLMFGLKSYFYFNYISLVSFLLILTILFFKKSIFLKDMFTFKLSYRVLTKEFYTFASPLFIFNIVAIAISLFDIWLLQYVSGSAQTGFYGLAYSIAAVCFLFTGAMTPLIMREFSKSFEKHDIHKVQMLFQRYVPMLYAIASFFAVFIAFQSEALICLFADSQFSKASAVLMVMAFYPIHQTYGQLSSSLFFAMEETIRYRNIGLVISFAGLVFTYVFIYFLKWGAIGFAWKMVLIQIIGVNVQLYFNVKSLQLKLLPFIQHQVVSLLFFTAIAYFSTQLFSVEENSIIYIFVQGIVYAFLGLLGVFFFPYIVSSTRSEIQLSLKKAKDILYKHKRHDN